MKLKLILYLILSEDDDQFINDDEIEDDTLVDYRDSEEDLYIEEDTNIDE